MSITPFPTLPNKGEREEERRINAVLRSYMQQKKAKKPKKWA